MLDTHLLVWLLTADARIDKRTRSLIDDRSNEVTASVVSIWEVAVKWPLRRGGGGDMPFSGAVFAKALEDAGIEMLDCRAEHAVALDELSPLHGDPFDRLLLATARHEGMTLVTHDARLGEYGANVRLI